MTQAPAAAAMATPSTVARIIAAADAERRRLERNLHDGAQQRLVSLALALRAVEAQVTNDPRRPDTSSPARARSRRWRSTSCATLRAGSTRPSSATAVSARR